MLLIIGFGFGVNKTFMDTTSGYFNKAIGVLSLALSIVLFISCLSEYIQDNKLK